MVRWMNKGSIIRKGPTEVREKKVSTDTWDDAWVRCPELHREGVVRGEPLRKSGISAAREEEGTF